MYFQRCEHCVVDYFYIKGGIATRIRNVNQNGYSSVSVTFEGLVPLRLLLCGDACS